MFRPNVKLVLEPGAGARIVDDLSRRTLTLTPTEGRILALLVPGSTAESLAAAAKGAGIDIESKQVEALLTRLHANELIDYTPSPAAKVSQPVLLPDDKVPAFRTDLGVAAAPKSGLMLVTDKARDRSFTLYDFEVHIARLLDGRKTVSQVIELAGKIGIPMTPESLSKFIGQMRAYGFVVDEPVAPPSADDQTWPARSQWSPEIRELYQSALRQFRLGRPGHALEYLDALLEIQPDTPEAVELKARVEAHLEAGPVTELSFEDLHGVDEPMPSLVAAGELMGGSGEHPAIKEPPPPKPKGPIWSPPAKTGETPALKPKGPIWSPPLKTGEVPAYVPPPPAAAPEPKPSAPKGPIWSPPAKPASLLEPEPLQIAVGPRPSAPPLAAGDRSPFAKTVISRPSAPIPPPAPDERPLPPIPHDTPFAKTVITRPSAPVFPPKTGEVPAHQPDDRPVPPGLVPKAPLLVEPEPQQSSTIQVPALAVAPVEPSGTKSRAIFPPRTGEQPALKPDDGGAGRPTIELAAAPVEPSGAKSRAIFPPRTGEQPALGAAPLEPSGSMPRPSPISARKTGEHTALAAAPVEPSGSKSRAIFPPRTGEQPALGAAPLEPSGSMPRPSPITARKTGEQPALGAAPPEPSGSMPRPSPITARKTGEQPALGSAPLEPSGSMPRPSPITPRKTGEQPALGSAPLEPSGSMPRPSPVTPRKTGEQPALGSAPPEPSGSLPRKTAELPVVAPDDGGAARPTIELATAPVQPSSPKSRAIFPPRKTGEQPVLDSVPPKEPSSSPPRKTAELPVQQSDEATVPPTDAPVELAAAPVAPSGSRPRPTRTGEVPVLLPVSETAPVLAPVTSEPKPRASAPRPRASRPTAPTVEQQSASPLEAPPTEVMSGGVLGPLTESGTGEVPAPMPERTVVGPPPEPPAARSSAPRPRASAPRSAPAAEGGPVPEAPPPARRSTGQRVPKQQEPAPNRTLLYVGIGVVVLLAGLAFPIPAVQRIDVQLLPTAKAEPKMPAGVFGKLEVQSGARVAEKAVIASLDVSKQKAEKEELGQTAARLDAASKKALSKANPALLKKAKLAVAKAQGELSKAKAGLARAKDRQKAELDLSRKETALERAERYAIAVDAGEKAKSLKIEATATRERITKLQAEIDRAFVTAPASGVFELDTLPPAGAQFDEGTPFGRIVDDFLVIKGAPLDAKDPVLLVGDRRVPLFGVDKRAEGLTVPFEGGVKPGPAVLEVSKGYRPWPMVVLAR